MSLTETTPTLEKLVEFQREVYKILLQSMSLYQIIVRTDNAITVLISADLTHLTDLEVYAHTGRVAIERVFVNVLHDEASRCDNAGDCYNRVDEKALKLIERSIDRITEHHNSLLRMYSHIKHPSADW